MTIRFRCGHLAKVDPDKGGSLTCHCGESRIARVMDAAHPRFTGVASGPLVETRDLPPMAVSLKAGPDGK